jgi:DNA topoisomerase-1
VHLIYDGEYVSLSPEAEEVATFFASTLGTEWCEKPKFRDNFWSDFTALLPANTRIKKLEVCDFSKIKEFLDNRSAARKTRTKEEKEKESELKKEQEHVFTHAIVDGLRERVGNFRTEPQNLFRGRGEHPKMGQLKRKIFPEDVTLNIGPDAPVPRIDHPMGHAWKEVLHDNTVTWLAYYHDTINGLYKYMFLNAASGFKGESDWEKYEKARRLKKFIHQIRNDYEKKLMSNQKHDRNLGTVAYLIDRLALRVGNEKNVDEEADTVGCCSLRVEHMRFEDNCEITLDFLGKDSIRYLNTVKVDSKVYSNLQQFCQKKKQADMIFDIDPNDINTYFKGFMSDLSAKVFRTYNASITLEGELNRLMSEKSPIKSEAAIKAHSMDVDIADLVKVYNEANRRVAILCNHQRAPPKQHEAGMAQMRTKLEELNKFVDALRVLKNEGKRHLSDEQKQTLETNSYNINSNEPQVQRKIHTLLVQVDKVDRAMEEKEENKSVSLTTSKINYMDPRISVAFCKRTDLPIERVFAKTIRNKFPWAMHARSDWAF